MSEDGMVHARIAVLLLLVVVPAVDPNAGWRLLASETQPGCAAEFARLCKSQHPSTSVQTGCLRQYWTSLSPACRKTLGSSSNTDANTDDSSE